MEYEQFTGKELFFTPDLVVAQTFPISSHNFKCGAKNKLARFLTLPVTAVLGSVIPLNVEQLALQG
jgi:hypothetical protein